MSWNDHKDVFATPAPLTERDKRDRRIAGRVLIVAAPFLVAWVVASPLVHIFLSKSAEAKIKTFGYHAASIYNEVVPCRRWFDGGFKIAYETTPNSGMKYGWLCRGIFDDDWTWYPK